jgi:hypothetical protein
MSDSITLYRFLSARWALKTLEERRFRVSRITELNDPFEWRIGVVGDSSNHIEIGRKTFDEFVTRFNEKIGIISLSAIAHEPVLWSHYADSHQGIALEVDYEREGGLESVSYSHALPTFNVSHFLAQRSGDKYTQRILRETLARKSLAWSYEREHRVHLDLPECEEEDGQFYQPIPDDFLRRVILGIRCQTSVGEVRKILAASGLSSVEVVQARMSDTAYEILTDSN